MDFLTYLSQHLLFSAPIVVSLALLGFSLLGDADADVDLDMDVDLDLFSLGQVPKSLLLALLLMFFGLIGAYIHFSGFLTLMWSAVAGSIAGVVLVLVSAKRLSWLFRDWGKPDSIATLMGKQVKIKRTYSAHTGQGFVQKDDGTGMIINVKLDKETCGNDTLHDNLNFHIYAYDKESNMYLISDI